MNAKQAMLLKQPCKNRGLSFEQMDDGSIKINGLKFDLFSEAEAYLWSIPRIDFSLEFQLKDEIINNFIAI